MDPIEGRLKVLRLACHHHNTVEEDDTVDKTDMVLATAKAWGDWVVGGPPRESKTAGQGKGLDAEAAAARGEKV